MILLLDNYDSFTWNLVHQLGSLGAEVEVVRNDALSVADIIAKAPAAIVLSPGPCTPNEAGVCVPLLQALKNKPIPLLGVCLGHQAIGQAFGGDVVRAPLVMHGKTDTIQHNGTGLFQNAPQPMTIMRYHSLVIKPENCPAELEPLAHTADGVIQAVQHRSLPIWGVQFHPESIGTPDGHILMRNFLQLAGLK